VLPLLISVPHAGLRVPPEASELCRLSDREIERDGDEGAREIYAIESQVARFVTTDIARAIIDLNRAENDRRKDGVVKTHTCWNVPVYKTFPSDTIIETLLARYYRPYHSRLSRLAGPALVLAVDCHTMAAIAPPIGPDPGAERPWVCLSNGDGTCPQEWLDGLRRRFVDEFGQNVTVNDPFSGGYITRTHASEMPWIQLELSRAPFLTNREKQDRVIRALGRWIEGADWAKPRQMRPA